MKQSFFSTIMKDEEMSAYINGDYKRSNAIRGNNGRPKYETIKRRLMRLDCPIRILERLDALYEDWNKPAPPYLSVEERERLFVELVATLPPNTTFADERIEWERGGFKGHLTRTYLPNPQRKKDDPLVTERDVEYHFQGSNSHLARNVGECKHWTAWGYVNREGYLASFSHKSVSGTEYGVQWYYH